MPPLRYELLRQDDSSRARLGRVTTPHGSFDTPAFMPVGTQATIKGLLPTMVAELNSQIILANTYHLMLRPGSELIAQMGGLHQWMRWDRPILTDSGGFQVFSLSDINQIDDDGVRFKSHLDGKNVLLTPARSMEVQNQLGADIIMAFDDCPPANAERDEAQGLEAAEGADESAPPLSTRASRDVEGESPNRRAPKPKTTPERLREAVTRSARWLDLCVAAHARKQDQALFGIVQGGIDLDLRTWSASHARGHDLPGYAIGGVAVGEGYEQLVRVVQHTAPLLPEDRPRYLMGVGYERDILAAVRSGVDMFDCVLPTRNGRNANAFTPTGQMRLRNAKYAADAQVIDPECDCPACGTGKGFSRSYLRHLFAAGEMLGPILVSAHNIRHFQRYLLDIRQAIAHNDWSLIARRWPVAMA
ncbi:MAG: tRNA guanosine(34) transglycosylase Tgt [Planctomycetota bacterium]|nr:tRNA guanosine(34) transglycosylase Tgt [Planctomycetota bacterium]